VRVRILGSGGRSPSSTRETSCVLVRDGERALLLDMGSGARRLLSDASLLDGCRELHVVLTHFHFDHVCGLPYLPWLDVDAGIWAPGRWLYDRDSAEILEPLRRPPIAPSDVTETYCISELVPGSQTIGGFAVRASPQPRHWAPSAGLRVDDHLAYVTDTPYEASSAELAEGVSHLLHEAWSPARAPLYPDRDATSGDAGRVAREAAVGTLTLIHLNPTLAEPDLALVLEDARDQFAQVTLGEDGLTFA
jgi:ribonuclease BN (tRNA processing enzyme)